MLKNEQMLNTLRIELQTPRNYEPLQKKNEVTCIPIVENEIEGKEKTVKSVTDDKKKKKK